MVSGIRLLIIIIGNVRLFLGKAKIGHKYFIVGIPFREAYMISSSYDLETLNVQNLD